MNRKDNNKIKNKEQIIDNVESVSKKNNDSKKENSQISDTRKKI